jgi:hypothetical protein
MMAMPVMAPKAVKGACSLSSLTISLSILQDAKILSLRKHTKASPFSQLKV